MIDVVVVNWNSGAWLSNCIRSINEYGGELIAKIIVVDNGSIDGSDASVENLPDVKLIRAGANLGFARACNLGAQLGTSEFLLFLNPDAAVHAETLSKSIACMQQTENSKTGICGVQLLDESGHIARSCARFPTALGLVTQALGLNRLFPRLGHHMDEWDHVQSRHVDHVIGAFYLVRRGLYESLRGFDERFFVYLEDVDFSYRAYKAGWSSLYLADVQAFHAGGGTSAKVKARRLFYSLRSRLQYAFKHFSSVGAVGVLLMTLLAEPVSRSVLALLRRSISALVETWLAYGLLWRWLPRWALKGETR